MNGVVFPQIENSQRLNSKPTWKYKSTDNKNLLFKTQILNELVKFSFRKLSMTYDKTVKAIDPSKG